jgi:hypothetical protein
MANAFDPGQPHGIVTPDLFRDDTRFVHEN